MTILPKQNLSKLAIHTQTFKHWSLIECINAFEKSNIGGICVWRHTIDEQAGGVSIDEATKRIADSPLAVPSLVRGGFFVGNTKAQRQKALDENRVCIDEAAALGADMIVLVVGAMSGVPLAKARGQVAEGLKSLLPYAEKHNIKLAIEPLHPMYAGDKSCISRMKEARQICEQIDHPLLGIALDVYHVWWDPDLQNEIALAGEKNLLFGFHLCDWRVPTRDLLTDRALMGEGCIDIAEIRGMVEQAGFSGYHEVEIFSQDYWKQDPDEYLQKIIKAYQDNT